MIPATWPHYRQALARPHKVLLRVEVWRAGIKLDELSPARIGNNPYTYARPVFGGGNLRATYGSRVTRTLSITIPEQFFPWGDRDLLAPWGNELRVWRGIEYGDGSRDEFQVFRGPIVRPSRPSGGRFTLDAADRAYLVVKAGFAAPERSSAGTLVVDEMVRLIRDAVPDATFGRHDDLTELVPTLAYDDDRGAALDNLAKSASAVWHCLGNGDFVIRRAPWSIPPSQAPVYLTDGPGGTIGEAYPTPDVEGVFNRVTVTSELPDGGAAMWATAEDADPTSPTYVNGPFGKRAVQIRVTGATSQDQLYREAQALLRRSRARATSWQYSIVPDASLELGDLIDSSYRERRARQYIAGFGLPLDVTNKMTVDGHDLIDTEVSG